MKHHLRKTTEGRFTITSGILIGTIAAIVISFLLTGVLTSFVLKGSIGAERTDIPIFFVRVFSILVGALVATEVYKEKMLMTVGIVTTSYLVLLLALSIIFFDAGIKNLVGGVLSVVTGGTAACIIRLSGHKKPRYGTIRKM